MSRLYNMQITVAGAKKGKKYAILAALSTAWDYSDQYVSSDSDFSVVGESYLYAGEGEDEFADRIAALVWEVNGEYCNVIVDATYLEDLPTTTYEQGKAEYAEWKAKNEASKMGSRKTKSKTSSKHRKHAQ